VTTHEAGLTALSTQGGRSRAKAETFEPPQKGLERSREKNVTGYDRTDRAAALKGQGKEEPGDKRATDGGSIRRRVEAEVKKPLAG